MLTESGLERRSLYLANLSVCKSYRKRSTFAFFSGKKIHLSVCFKEMKMEVKKDEDMEAKK